MSTLEITIKLRIQELCRTIIAPHISKIPERNEFIIQTIVNEFGVSYEYATECFLHNKEIGN